MSGRWFDGDAGDNADVLAFVGALNVAVDNDPIQIDPDEIWIVWLGACLYIAVTVPALQGIQGFARIASELEVCYWPDTAHGGRAVEAGWGDSGHPLDSQIDLRLGRLEVRERSMSVEAYAAVTLSWLREQLARPLELRCWARPSARRIVLSDSGDVVAGRGLRPWWRAPDVVQRLR